MTGRDNLRGVPAFVCPGAFPTTRIAIKADHGAPAVVIGALRRTLSRELGPKGAQVVTLQTGGIPEGLPDQRTRKAIEKSIAKQTMLGRAATLEDVGNAAVVAASDWGRSLTATKLNITCDTIPD